MLANKLLLGQYWPGDSLVRRIHPLAKILISLIYMIILFVANDWLGWGILTLVCVLAVAFSRVPVKALLRGLRFIAILCAITVVINILVYPGETIWSWGILRISRPGITYGLAMALRLLLLVVFASLLTLTTRPILLTDGLEQLLSPLRRFKLPVHEMAMMASIALRFIPTVLEEFDRIVLAQRARGVSLRAKGLMRKINSFIPMIVPLFVSAFRRADELAQAMEAKCYRGGEGRTSWRLSLWQRRDSVALGLFLLLALAVIVERIAL